MDSDKSTVSTVLPEAFLDRMKDMLGDDYQAFLQAYDQPRTYGLRVNTAKISCEEFEKIVPFEVKKIPWIPNGYFYSEDIRPSRCPLYQAGLYYLQEPSAMTPASRIPIEPGEYVLDMCAAPGGKATAAGAALKGQGLLVANDISTTRARALLVTLNFLVFPIFLWQMKSRKKWSEIFLNFSIRLFWMLHAPEKACSEKKKHLPKTGLPRNHRNYPRSSVSLL